MMKFLEWVVWIVGAFFVVTWGLTSILVLLGLSRQQIVYSVAVISFYWAIIYGTLIINGLSGFHLLWLMPLPMLLIMFFENFFFRSHLGKPRTMQGKISMLIGLVIFIILYLLVKLSRGY